MKTKLTVLLMLVMYHVSIAQYTVTKVIGVVKNKTSGETLKPGSRLTDDDILAFSSPNDMLRVIVAGKGIYVISPSDKGEKQQNEIVEILKSALHIKSKEGYLSGRSEDDETIPAILQTEPEVNNKTLFESENKYIFDKSKYNVSNGSKFFLQIESPGQKPAIRSLKTRSDTLIIYSEDFANNDASEEAAYKLGFFSKEKNSSEALVQINPFFDRSGEMENIMKIIISESKQTDSSELQNQCYAEVYEALGKPPIILFRNTFNRLHSEILKN